MPRRGLWGTTMIKTTTFLLATLVAAPAFAADLEAPVAAKPAAAPAPTTTIGIEISPEFKTTDNSLADVYAKGSLSESLGNGFSVGTSFQFVDKSGSPATYQYLVDVSGAYKFKLSDNFSVTTTGGLGYNWGATGIGAGGVQPFLYYYASAAFDAKIDSNWTLNILNARYRNGIGVTWITPKVQTGITYNIDSTHAVYANIGYAWKDTGAGLNPDKWNVATGYKFSF